MARAAPFAPGPAVPAAADRQPDSAPGGAAPTPTAPFAPAPAAPQPAVSSRAVLTATAPPVLPRPAAPVPAATGATDAAGGRLRDAGLVLAMALVALLVPPVLYGALAYRQFGVLDLSYYVPYEELLAALRTANALEIARAPLVSVNMTSGLVVASMFTLSVGQFFLSSAIGALIGLHLAARLALRASCAFGATTGPAAAGSGLAATVAASGAGLVGCCGPGLSGGVLALLGVGANTAHLLAHVGPPLQAGIVVLLAAAYLRVRRRARRAGLPGA